MKSKEIALNGILVTLTIVILYSASIIPISTITILTIVSCIIPVALIKGSLKSAILVYAASLIISFFIIPINIVIMYGLFFGVYPIVKHFIEKLNKMPLEIGAKLIWGNISFLLGLFLLKVLGMEAIFQLPLVVILLLVQPAILIYDYALTLLIGFYFEKIHNHIK